MTYAAFQHYPETMNKNAALKIVREAAENGVFTDRLICWHEDFPGAGYKGNISGVLLHRHLANGQSGPDCAYLWDHVAGIPWQVGEMADQIYCGLALLPNKRRYQEFAFNFLEAIRPGADLSNVPETMAAHMLEKAEWCAGFADEKTAHQAGIMHALMLMRMQGLDKDGKRIADFYNDHLYKLRRHQTECSGIDINPHNAARAALCSLCKHFMERRIGPLSYFLKNCVNGAAATGRASRAWHWLELSNTFLNILKGY